MAWRAWLRATLSSSRLTALVGLGFAAGVLLATALLARYERDELIERISERNELLARVMSDNITRNVEASALAAATLDELLEGGMPARSEEVRVLMSQTLVNLPFLRGIALLASDGTVITSTDVRDIGSRIPLAPLGPLPGGAEERLGPLVQARFLKDLVPTPGRAATPQGVSFLPLMRGVMQPQGDMALLVVLINVQSITNAQQLLLGDEPAAAAALLSYEGLMMAATDGLAPGPRQLFKQLPAFTRFLPQFEHGSWVGEGLRPGAQIVAFRVSPSRPLVVLVEHDREAAVLSWWHTIRGLVAAGLASALLIGLMSWMAVRSLRARERARAERDLAQQEVARREREMSVTLRSLQELIFRSDAEGLINFANQHWAVVAGHESAVLGRPVWALVVPEHRAACQGLFTPDAALGVRNLQVAFELEGAGRRSYELSVMPLIRQGQVIGFAGSAVDVTERVESGRKLAAQLAFTELLMDISPLPAAVTDLSGRYVMVNRAWEEFTGVPRQQAVGQMGGGVLTPLQVRTQLAYNRQVLETGEPVRIEAQFSHRDGSQRDIVINKVLMRGADQQPSGILTLYMDVTEFREAERATREARDAAEEASRSKSEFIANISHELRTPLQSIIGFSELGLARAGAQERLSAMFGEIHAGGQRMLSLVNDLLDVAKIESTVGTIHLERLDLRGVLRTVARELAPQMSQRQLRVALELPELPLLAKVDPLRIAQVVRNVVANAVKFSPAGGLITLRGTWDDEGCPSVEVRDQGPGVPEAELGKIFEAFAQSSRTKDGSGGTGLGLAICRKILDAHGGHIRAANLPEGGAVFVITLPQRVSGDTEPMP